MFLACAPQSDIILFALELSQLPMGGRVSVAILGGNSPFSEASSFVLFSAL